MQQAQVDSVAEMMAEITRLAPLKDHHLAKDMVNGSRPLARQAAEAALRNLRRCPDLAVPRAAQGETAPAQDIPPGYYATTSRTGANDLDFWKVERPGKGKYAGWTFAKRVLGGGSDGQTRCIQVQIPEQRAALASIGRQGVEESRMLYAVNMKRCTRCNRDLSDDLSRERGMGGDCWNKSQGAL